jgi:hypothetical protein
MSNEKPEVDVEEMREWIRVHLGRARDAAISYLACCGHHNPGLSRRSQLLQGFFTSLFAALDMLPGDVEAATHSYQWDREWSQLRREGYSPGDRWEIPTST